MAIQMRRGLSKDFDPQKMRAGEWAVTIDADTQRQMVYMCFGAGVVKRMGTFDDLEAELDPYKEAVQAYKESAERSATNASLSERNAKQSEINAKASEVSAKESAEKAMSTTPEGYAQLVDDVGKIPLFSAQGTSLSLDTARGGVRVNKVVGKTYKSKNLIDFSKITKGKELGSDGRVVNNSEWYVTDFVFVKPSTTYTLSGTSSVMRVEYDASGNVVADKTANSAIFTTSSKTVKVRFNSKISGYSNPMLNEGGTALPYEPYGLFSSGDMGYFDGEWTQGYVVAGGDIASSSTYITATNMISVKENDVVTIDINNNNVNRIRIGYKQNGMNKNIDFSNTNKCQWTVPSGVSQFRFDIGNNFQVATAPQVSITINGNYAITVQERGKNLLNPTLKGTTTINGITCVEKDGTYTLNGTASATCWFKVVDSAPLKMGIYKLVGCPAGGKTSSGWMFQLSFIDEYGGAIDYGDGALLTFPENTNKNLYIGVSKGTVCNNLVFKPMLTKDLDVTYDFMPYRAKDVIIPLAEPLYEQNVLDVENQQIVKKYASVDLGELNWAYSSDYSAWFVSVSGIKSSGMCYSDKYEYSPKSASQLDVGTVTISSVVRVYVRNGSSTEKPNGNLIYELATPTTEPLTSEQAKALHSLESYNGKTYIDTTDTYAKATFEVEYGKTDGVALAIQAKNDARLAYEEQKLIPRISVIDNYLSVSQTSALSAARGKDLNTRLLILEQLLTMSEGQGTKTNNVSSGDCYWWRFGKVVVGQIACTVANVTVYYSNVALFSGLPDPNHSAICGGVEVDGDWTSSAFISIEADGSLNLHMREETLAKRTIQANFVYILP